MRARCSFRAREARAALAPDVARRVTEMPAEAPAEMGRADETVAVGQIGDAPAILRIAEASGFTVLNLSGVFKDHDLKSYALAEWDMHPNAFGHQVIAARLFDELIKRHDLIIAKR